MRIDRIARSKPGSRGAPGRRKNDASRRGIRLSEQNERISPLRSPAIGSGKNDLIRACDEVLRASEPARPGQGPPVALCFSGGGFRATLSALRFVADAGLLGNVRYVSSVSGGSVASGLFASRYEELEEKEFSPEGVDAVVIKPFVRQVTRKSLSRALVANIWRTLGPKTRTDVLADLFDRWFFGGRELETLSERCRFNLLLSADCPRAAEKWGISGTPAPPKSALTRRNSSFSPTRKCRQISSTSQEVTGSIPACPTVRHLVGQSDSSPCAATSSTGARRVRERPPLPVDTRVGRRDRLG